MQVARARRRAFTLVEILIGLVILLILVGILWQIMSSWMRDTSIGIWREVTSQKIQRTTAVLRKHIESASYPTGNTPESVVGANNEAHFLVINPKGEGNPYSVNAAWDEEDWTAHPKVKMVQFGPGTGNSTDDVVIMTIIVGTPGFARIPGFPDRKVSAKRIRLLLTGKKPVFYKGDKGPYKYVQKLVLETTAGTPVDPEVLQETDEIVFSGSGKQVTVMEDVNSVIAWGENLDAAKTDVEEYVPVGLKFLCVESGRGRATIIGRLMAEPKTGVWVK